jgi:RNA methyltransferase, TrmH family
MARAYGARPVPGSTATGERTVAGTLDAIRRARRDPDRVLLEGLHALKHAVRFGADIEVVATPDPAGLARLLDDLAPDVAPAVDAVALDAAAWREAVGRDLPSPAVAVARRPAVRPDDVLAAPGTVVVLEEPRHLGNLGAVVRVAAAASAGGVLVVGDADPWHPTAVRGGAGLQFALPIARCASLPATTRPVVALDAGGEDLTATRLPPDAVLLVGTERGGLGPQLRGRAGTTLAIPMRAGVSSLNLATAVAVALYAR